MMMGQSFVPDDSVIQSATNAVEAVRSWLWLKARANLTRFHVAFQIRSILEGAPGQGVSGPSAGYAMLNALVSELSGIPIPQSRVMTGTIGLKMDIGPVGGLGGRGREAGKLVGILKAEKIKVTDLLVPESNFKNASDEMKMIPEESMTRLSFELVDPNSGEGASAEAVVERKLIEDLNSYRSQGSTGKAFLIWIDTEKGEVSWQLRKIPDPFE